MKHTVESLRKSGHKVRVIHNRYADVDYYSSLGHIKGEVYGPLRSIREAVNLLDAKIKGNDGETFVQVTFPDGLTVEGFCAQLGNYSNKAGVETALDSIFAVAKRDRNQPREYPMLKAIRNESNGELVVLFTSLNRGTIVHATGEQKIRIGENCSYWDAELFQEIPVGHRIVLFNE